MLFYQGYPFKHFFSLLSLHFWEKCHYWTQPNAIYNVDHQFLLIFQGFKQDILSDVFEAENIKHLSQKALLWKDIQSWIFHLFQNFQKMGLRSHSVLLNSVAAELQSWSWQAKATRHTFIAPHSLTCFLYFKYNILIFQSFSMSGAGHELGQRKGDCQVFRCPAKKNFFH